MSVYSRIFDLDLQSGEKLILLAISHLQDIDGKSSIKISIENLAKLCRMSVRAAQGHISKLVKTGILERVDRPGRSSIFSIAFDPLMTEEN